MSITSRSQSHVVRIGKTADMWHTNVRPLVANFRTKYERARRDEIVME
ncbi:MAG TPA: hypothetical protein VGE67_07975 [Haloferula sp.]